MQTYPTVGAQFIAPSSLGAINQAPTDLHTAFNPATHHRRSIRLHDYDYSQAGAYFITICTQNRVFLFGEIVGENMRLNDAGQTVQNIWDALPDQYPCVELDAFVVMPNHIHGIVMLKDVVERFVTPHPPTIGEIIRSFKARCSHDVNQLRKMQDVSIWQTNFYEHVIRNELSLHEIREYIANNPTQWANDHENPNAMRNNESCGDALWIDKLRGR